MTDDAEAWMGQLWLENYDAILRFAYRRLPDQAEEVASETFMTAWRRRADVPKEARPWLFVTAKNIILTRTRGQMRYDALLTRAKHEHMVEIQPDVADLVTERAGMRFAWLSLSSTEREALALVGWDGLDNAQAAEVAGCTTATFAVRLFRARRRFVSALNSATRHAPQPYQEGAKSVS